MLRNHALSPHLPDHPCPTVIGHTLIHAPQSAHQVDLLCAHVFTKHLHMSNPHAPSAHRWPSPLTHAPQGAHHVDLMYAHPADPPSLTAAREVEMAHVRRWIEGAQARKATAGGRQVSAGKGGGLWASGGAEQGLGQDRQES